MDVRKNSLCFSALDDMKKEKILQSVRPLGGGPGAARKAFPIIANHGLGVV